MEKIDELLCIDLIKKGKGDLLNMDQYDELYELGYIIQINDGKIIDIVKEEDQ